MMEEILKIKEVQEALLQSRMAFSRGDKISGQTYIEVAIEILQRI